MTLVSKRIRGSRCSPALPGSWWRFLLAAVLLSFAAAVDKSLAADPRSPTGNPSTVIFTKSPASTTAGGAAALLGKAKDQGRIRVVAGLRMVMRPEHALSAPEIEQQRRTLQEIETAVLARVLPDGARAAAEAYAFQTVPFIALFVDGAQLQRLLADPQVASVEHHEPLPPVGDRSGPAGPTPSAGWDTIAFTQAPEVWSRGYGGEAMVAVLDAGVHSGRARDKQGNKIPAHPMLAGKVVSEACYSNAGRGGESLCPAGVPTAAGAPGPKGEDGAAAPCDANLPHCWHGTHVASIAAGNSGARFGIARGASVIAIQVFTRFAAGAAVCGERRSPCIASYPEDQAKALERVLTLQKTFTRLAAVVLSPAGGRYAGACDADFPLLATLTAQLRSAGVATVAPAGNRNLDGFVSAPACLSKTVAVGSATQEDKVHTAADYGSNHAAMLALTAPGAAVGARTPALYAEATGTGAAAAHVAGGFALLKHVKPMAGVDEILAAMACTGKAVERNGIVKPRLSLLDAYRYLVKARSGGRTWTFNRPADAEDWLPVSGTWAVQNGAYVGTPAPDDASLMTSLPNCHGSWDLTIALQRIDPLRTNYPTGIIVQASMDADKWLKGYFLTFSPTGDANIWRLDGRTRTFLCPERGKFPVSVNDFNTIKVVRKDTLLSYHLNGTLVCSIRDGVYGSGAVVVSAPLAERKQGDALAVKLVELKPLGAPAEAGGVPIDPEKLWQASAGAPGSTPQPR